ncbi:hypothetical protein PT974_07109 [Cladobotryum mycophilum]|uniref:SMP-30/Gluconolactonase/LRE-like region domain-containing protein n=1 Tax=Cladobotryum mycophilum TaxID=491253 RepID=A0ABR0SNK0_9HYPO
MIFPFSIIIIIIAFLGTGLPVLCYRVKLLYQFPYPFQQFENIAVHPRGGLILTTWGDGSIYTLDPHAKDTTPQLLVKVPGIDSLTGITETTRGVYAIAGGLRSSQDYQFFHGSAMIMTLNLNTGLITGMAALPSHPHYVFMAEPLDDCLRIIDLMTGAYQVAHRLREFGVDRPRPPGSIPFGVNGLKIRNDTLYFTNSGQLTLGRMKLGEWGTQVGKIRILTTLRDKPLQMPNDFALSRNGKTAYIATHPNTIVRFARHKKWNDVVETSYFEGNSTVPINSPTAAALSNNEKVLYVTTRGTHETGGQILEIRLEKGDRGA